MRRSILLAPYFLLILGFAPTAHVSELELTVESTSITAKGKSLVAGDTVVFKVVSWPDQPWIPKLEAVFESVVVGKKGKAVLPWPVGSEIPFRTVAVAVNSRDGAWGQGVPKNFPFVTEDLLPDAFIENEKTGYIEAIRIDGRRFEYLVIRPDTGVWDMSSRDGSLADIDGITNRSTTAPLSEVRSNGRFGSPPSWLVPGDLVIAIDARTMSAIVGGVS